jgi:hypothetical protein
MNRVTSHFDGPDAVMARIEQDLPADSLQSSRDADTRDSWDLELGLDGALDAYAGGWAEGAARAYALAETLRPRPRGTRTALRRGVAGGMPNVPATLAGAPDAMYRVTQQHAGARPFVHLYMPIGYACSINANTAFDRGCALVALADALETAGARVKVTAMDVSDVGAGRHGGNGGHVRYVATFTMKDYADRLDVDSLIFTIAHPAFFRRICFMVRERSEHDAVRAATHNGYGTPCPIEPEDCPTDGHAITVTFPRLERNGGTPESFLREMVAALPETLATEIGAGT